MKSILDLRFWILDYRAYWPALFPSLIQNLKAKI